MKRRKKRLIPAAVCVLLFSLYLFRGHIEKAVLERILPGEWALLAGGGSDKYTFNTDGTAMISDRSGGEPYAVPWHLENADPAQREYYWSHPNVILAIGDEEYGIHLGLNSSLDGLYVNGKKVFTSPLSLSFSLTFSGDGGGDYVRPY